MYNGTNNIVLTSTDKYTLKFTTKYGKDYRYINFRYQEINKILGNNPDIVDYEIID